MSEDRTSFRRLGRDTLIYSVGVVLAGAVSFLMLPVYTRYLSLSDYGVLQLLEMTVEIAGILFIGGMTTGLGLFFFQTDDEQRRGRIVRTAFFMEAGLAGLATASIVIAAPLIWKHGMHGAGSPFLVRLAGLNLAFQTLGSAPLVLMQLRQLSRRVVLISLLKLLLQVSLNILFVVVLRLGVLGILCTGLIVNGLLGGALFVWLFRTTVGRPSWEIVRKLRQFGLPYQYTAAGAFILSFGDRFFLQASHGADAVGLYGLAYTFGFLLYQFSAEPLLKAWGPQRLQLIAAPADERNARNARGFFFFSVILITLATGIGTFVQPAIQLMTPPAFHGAARLVPVILAAYVAGAWMDALKFGIDVSEKTRYFSYANWIAVAVILVLYATLIPPFGGLGAALATLVAFIVRAGLVYYWSQRLWPLHYGWAPVMRLLVIGIAVVTAATFLPVPGGIVGSIGGGCCLVALYFALVWITVFGAEDRALVRRLLWHPRTLFAHLRR